jgi:hypothetical protein
VWECNDISFGDVSKHQQLSICTPPSPIALPHHISAYDFDSHLTLSLSLIAGKHIDVVALCEVGLGYFEQLLKKYDRASERPKHSPACEDSQQALHDDLPQRFSRIHIPAPQAKPFDS